jgi:hypothetical protein
MLLLLLVAIAIFLTIINTILVIDTLSHSKVQKGTRTGLQKGDPR